MHKDHSSESLTSVGSSLLGGGSLGVLGPGCGVGVTILFVGGRTAVRHGTSSGGTGGRPTRRTSWALRPADFLAGRGDGGGRGGRRTGNGHHRAPARARQGRGREHVRHARERADAGQAAVPRHRAVPGLDLEALAGGRERGRHQGPEAAEG